MTNNWWLNERLEPSVCVSMDERENMAKPSSFRFCRRKVHLFSLSYFHACMLSFQTPSIYQTLQRLSCTMYVYTTQKYATEQAIHELESERFVFCKNPLFRFNIKLPRSQEGHPEIVKHSPQLEKGGVAEI